MLISRWYFATFYRQGHKKVDAVVYDELIHLKTVEEVS